MNGEPLDTDDSRSGRYSGAENRIITSMDFSELLPGSTWSSGLMFNFTYLRSLCISLKNNVSEKFFQKMPVILQKQTVFTEMRSL